MYVPFLKFLYIHSSLIPVTKRDSDSSSFDSY